jgi:hypothetical protein
MRDQESQQPFPVREDDGLKAGRRGVDHWRRESVGTCEDGNAQYGLRHRLSSPFEIAKRRKDLRAAATRERTTIKWGYESAPDGIGARWKSAAGARRQASKSGAGVSGGATSGE